MGLPEIPAFAAGSNRGDPGWSGYTDLISYRRWEVYLLSGTSDDKRRNLRGGITTNFFNGGPGTGSSKKEYQSDGHHRRNQLCRFG